MSHLSTPSVQDAIQLEMRGSVAVIRLCRPAKRNALNDGLILALRDIFQNLPKEARAAVIHGEGEHFCAGLDLSELQERDAGEGIHHSRMWHNALECVEKGPVPVIVALHGAVVGGGLELASACHIRVADESAFFALPEGTRGIFVGGGGAVRIPKLIGAQIPFMLTANIIALTALDFLGYGLPPDAASLGELLLQGKNNLEAPWLVLSGFFTLAIVLSLLIYIGEAARDAFDPRR